MISLSPTSPLHACIRVRCMRCMVRWTRNTGRWCSAQLKGRALLAAAGPRCGPRRGVLWRGSFFFRLFFLFPCPRLPVLAFSTLRSLCIPYLVKRDGGTAPMLQLGSRKKHRRTREHLRTAEIIREYSIYVERQVELVYCCEVYAHSVLLCFMHVLCILEYPLFG